MPPKKKPARPRKTVKTPVPSMENFKEDYFGTIEVHIKSLESSFETGMFTLIIVYANNFVGKVSKIYIPDEGGKFDINRKFFLYIKAIDNYMMDSLISTPFFFSLLEGESRVDPKWFAVHGVAAAVQPNVVGQGNLGIMPLLTGQKEMDAHIILEPPGFQETVFFRRKFAEHPRLSLKLVDAKKNLSMKEMNNIMWLSVESVYNLDNSHFLEDAEHTLVFPLPSVSIDEEHALLEDMLAVGEDPVVDSKSEHKKKKTKGPKGKFSKGQVRISCDFPPQKVEIKKHPDLDLIQFDRGIFKLYQTIDIRKKWSSLASINGAPSMISERVRTDSEDLISPIPFDIRKRFRKRTEPRIEWNMFRPVWLHNNLENLVKERIIQYGVWPVELLMLGKLGVGQDHLPGSLKSKLKEDKNVMTALRTEIDKIFVEFKELLDEISKNAKEKVSDQIELTKRLANLETKAILILDEYEPKEKGNLLIHMPFIERLRAERKRKMEDGAAPTPAESGSETTEGAKEFLNQDDVVLMERKAYVAWVDLSPLLVPGCTHLRTAGLLQHFNREEAVAKWGLTTTFSGNYYDMSMREKEVSRMLRKDPVDINRIYMDLNKSDLIKGSNNLLLLLGRLLDLSYSAMEAEPSPSAGPEAEAASAPATAEAEEKKQGKFLKFEDEMNKKPPPVGIIKNHKESKINNRAHDGTKKKEEKYSSVTGELRTDSTNANQTAQNTEEKGKESWEDLTAFDVNEMRESFRKEKPKKSKSFSKTKSIIPTISDHPSTFRGDDVLKKKTMKHYLNRHPHSHSQNVFSIYKTEAIPEGKNISSKVGDSSTTADDNSRTESAASSLQLPPFPLISSMAQMHKISNLSERSSRFKSDDESSILRSTEQEELERLKQLVSIYSKKDHSAVQGSTVGMSQSGGELALLELLKSLLTTVITKYGKLRDRYDALKKIKAKEGMTSLKISDREATTSDSDRDEKATCGYPSGDELQLNMVDPRHRMWHVGGKHLEDDVIDNQTQYTNDVRKMAVLEEQFLLLKRIRLKHLRDKWEQEYRELVPEYLENSKGENVVVIIEIKLLKPLVPKPTLTEIDLEIKNFVSDRDMKKQPIHYVKDPVDDFHSCLINLCNLITSEYQDYKKYYSVILNPLTGEFGSDFYNYLEKSRAHQVITESLCEGMKGYLSTALRDPIPISADKADQKELRYYVGWLYSRMVDEIQSVVNKIIIDGDHSLPKSNYGNLPHVSNLDLFLFAVEAIEEMDYDRAKYYLSKRLDENTRKEPLYWIEYAVIALRIGDYLLAMEAVKEALTLNTRCKEGLIIYAVMLMMEGKFEDAMVFFNALVNFYPMFVEGWMAFHMFFLIIENKSGADITLVAGTKVAHDFELQCPQKPPQLSWDNYVLIKNESSSFISSAVYFLSFNLYEFAEVFLAQELERVGTKTVTWVYYLSVCHYIQGRYEDSAKHLSKAIAEINDYNMDPRVWMLLGHNCWMMGLKKCAIQMYIQAFTKKQNHLYEHMTFIRCGFFFLENDQAKFAKQMFLRAVRQQGTPMGWLGLGIALFMEGKMEDAELALKEANMLDTTMATAWGYLALISLYQLKEEQFLHCYKEAKRYGLNDKKLALEIETISEQIASFNKKRFYERGKTH